MSSKSNTRQEILDQAFAYCEETSSSFFSLSEIALRVGISKAAIFRHFKNKEDLLQEMNKVFWQDVKSLFADKEYFFERDEYTGCSYEEFCDLLSKFINFFLDKTGYLTYFINSVIKNKLKGDSLFLGLLSKGVSFSKSFVNNKNPKRFFKSYFCIVAVIYFVTYRKNLEHVQGAGEMSRDDFVSFICDFLWNGLGRKERVLSEEKIASLDEICKIDSINTEKDTKFFNAFIELFDEYGIDGITIDRLSQKLNLAKSSLYSFFNNKVEFINEMIVHEITSLMENVFGKARGVTSIDELIYIILTAGKNYLEQRPVVLMVHICAVKNSLTFKKDHKFSNFNIEEFIKYIEEKGVNTDLPFGIHVFMGFLYAQNGFLKLFLGNSKTAKVLYHNDYAKELFYLIEHGINIERNI